MRVDAILVLGGRVQPSGRPGRALSRRIERAIALARAVDAPIVACGGRRWGGAIEAEVIARRLVEEGVDPKRVILERRSMTTFENLREARRIVGKGPVAIVTCDWHCARAEAIADALGMEAVLVPASTNVRFVSRLGIAVREWLSMRFDLHLARRLA